MLLYFKVKNYRSFRDEAILDLEAARLNDHTDCLLQHGKSNYLPSAAIYGKNGGGKSNLIRAMWLTVQFICNAQRTQTEKSSVPVRPFGLNDYSVNEPTSFEFAYVLDGIKYVYGFSATRECIVSEYLKTWPNGREKSIFVRDYQEFIFPKDGERQRKQLISEAVAANQLFFAISCTMNYKPCIEAMRWFREYIVFSRDYTDINKNLIEYSEDEAMLQAIISAARTADIGIQDIKFEIDNKEIELSASSDDEPEHMRGMIKALQAFSEALRQTGNEAEIQLNAGKLRNTTYHIGTNADGKSLYYPLTLSDESDGTRRLMTLAPAIERTLANGGVLVVDGEELLIPTLVHKALGITLDEIGVGLVNVGSVGFDNVASVFSDERIRRRCSIVTDLDAYVKDAKKSSERASELGSNRQKKFEDLYRDHSWVKAFYAQYTLEVEFANQVNNRPFIKSVIDFQYTQKCAIERHKKMLDGNSIERYDQVLTLAGEMGKGWYATVLAAHIDNSVVIPEYILNAVVHASFDVIAAPILKKMVAYALNTQENSDAKESLNARLLESRSSEVDQAIISEFCEQYPNSMVARFIKARG